MVQSADMADPTHDQLLQEIYKLARDNNRMLHAMRRNAFIGGIVKLAIYALLVGVPIWFFLTYMMPVLNSAVGAINQVQGQIQGAQNVGAQIGSQFGSINTMMEQIKNIPGLGNFGE